MRTIGVVTVGRSDYGIYMPFLKKVRADSELQLQLIVAGMHLSPEFGLTVENIKDDGFEISERVEMLLSSDTPEGIAKSIGVGVMGFSQAYTRSRPEILVVLGDRFEMYAAALAALPHNIPVAHIHGGEVTHGAIDDALRHSMTKLSHLHFVSTQAYAKRVIQLGEEPWRVVVSGAPSLDNLHNIKLFTREELARNFNLNLDEVQFILATFHPVTLEIDQTEWQITEFLAALKEFHLPIIFTMPNADTSGRKIKQKIITFVSKFEFAQAVDNLGLRGYFSMMSLAATMAGNSSSGIIEAASFALPVVNVGTRQSGRVRGLNVIDVDNARESIIHGLGKALDPLFFARLKGMANPYGAGNASEQIHDHLKQININEKLLVKRFHDLNVGQ